jgi:hypothetical protein
MMIAEARLRNPPLKGADAPTVQSLVRRKRLAVSAVVVGMMAVLLLLILAYSGSG